MWRQLCIAGAQAGALTGTGDVLAQYHEHRTSGTPFSLDWQRSVKFAGVGSLIVGPALRIWYGVLNKHIGSSGKVVALKKVAIDQGIFAPPFIAVFISTLKVVEGKNIEEIKHDVQNSYFDILKANYCLWPWVQLCNFYLVPLRFQVLMAQSVALLWNTYLSWRTHKN